MVWGDISLYVTYDWCKVVISRSSWASLERIGVELEVLSDISEAILLDSLGILTSTCMVLGRLMSYYVMFYIVYFD